MLSSLHIRDFAIIDELEVDFGSGLNVMTGETGAGKTIIVEALNLVMGGRAQTDLVRAGSEKASVTAVFNTELLPSEVAKELHATGIECGDELIVHRVVGIGGKGRISINGVPVTGGSLKNIAARLVDVSSQHEHQLLLDSAEHVKVLDLFGGHDSLVDAYRTAHLHYIDLYVEVRRLEENEREAKERLEFLKFQLEEIESARLKPGEDAEIENGRSRLKHAVVLEEKTRGAEEILYRDAGSAVEDIDTAVQLLSESSKYDASVSKWMEGLERARAEIEEVARDLASYADGLESDPAALGAMEERLHLIRTLMRKHGGSIEACIEKARELKIEVDKIMNYDDILAEKRGDLEIAAGKRRAAAAKLRDARAKAAKGMGRSVAAGLSDLGMGKTGFSVRVDALEEEAWDETGPDRVEFLLAPNVGEPMMPLVRIASGGELSRVMLAIKGVLSDRARIAGTSIFDEVDSGIGGAIADVVGRKLKDVSKSRQVICITHLPQIAVYGDNHIRITKGVKDGRTVTSLKRLPDEERVGEIARMLGSKKITEATLLHAKEMLEHVR